MRKEIKAAYDGAAPGQETAQKMLQNIRAFRRPAPRRFGLRRALTAAACVAVVAALSLAGLAGYERWVLPKPETYTPSPEGGSWEIHSQTEETAPVTGETAPEMYTDAWFLTRAAELLKQAGLGDVDTDRMTVKWQKDLGWDREEVEITYPDSDVPTTVRFDAESGYLLHLSSIDMVQVPETAVCETLEEAIELARAYYERLPVPQGYVYTDCTEYDDQYWSLEFCREVSEGLYNPYEMVRIGLNPVSGRLVGLNVFYVPLLDDHGPGDEPLTREQAEAAVEACGKVHLEGKVQRSADISVVLPNWFFTDYMADSVNAKASDVTRLAWVLVYEDPDSEFADAACVYVDLYTGEILGGDVTA